MLFTYLLLLIFSDQNKKNSPSYEKLFSPTTKRNFQCALDRFPAKITDTIFDRFNTHRMHIMCAYYQLYNEYTLLHN